MAAPAPRPDPAAGLPKALDRLLGLVPLAIAIIWRNEMSGKGDYPWTRCTESLIEQVFSDKCTLRFDDGSRNPA